MDADPRLWMDLPPDHCDVDDVVDARGRQKTPKSRRAAVADDRQRFTSKLSAELSGARRRDRVADQVDTSVHSMEAMTSKSPRHRLGVEAKRNELTVLDDAVLPGSGLRHGPIIGADHARGSEAVHVHL